MPPGGPPAPRPRDGHFRAMSSPSAPESGPPRVGRSPRPRTSPRLSALAEGSPRPSSSGRVSAFVNRSNTWRPAVRCASLATADLHRRGYDARPPARLGEDAGLDHIGANTDGAAPRREAYVGLAIRIRRNSVARSNRSTNRTRSGMNRRPGSTNSLGIDETNVPSAGPEGAAASRHDVLHPLDVGTVGQCEDVRVASSERVDRRSVYPTGLPSSVHEDPETRQSAREPPCDRIEDVCREWSDDAHPGRRRSHRRFILPRPSSSSRRVPTECVSWSLVQAEGAPHSLLVHSCGEKPPQPGDGLRLFSNQIA
jgi:hypothetical protein